MRIKSLSLILVAGTLVACSDGAPQAEDAPAPAASSELEAPPPMVSDDAVSGGDNTPAPADPSNPADSAQTEAAYLGRWVGVEGMYLEVESKPGGGVSLQMQWDLDNSGAFDGSVTAEGLRFMREGLAETAVHTDGNATGLKHLAGKTDCLTVKQGEGYCRD